MDNAEGIKQVTIENFKSIRQLSFACRRVNVFVGEPGAGKSNLLEALGLFSFAFFSALRNYKLADFVRVTGLTDLFYDRIIDHPLMVQCDDHQIRLAYKDGSIQGNWASQDKVNAQVYGSLESPDLGMSLSSGLKDDLGFIRFYRFQGVPSLKGRESNFLLPPFGENLISVLLAHADVFEEAGYPFENLGLSLNIRLPELELEVQKRLKRVSISYPYVLASDTFQRVVFFLAAIRTSRNATLVLEEPEAHAFPYYTTSLAEDIGQDANQNQYFITTHNPYFLLPLVAKTPKEELSVFVTYLQDYQTRLRQLTSRELSNLDHVDLFWNLKKYAKRSAR